MATFDGFGEDTSAFLRGLSAQNDKVWFERHRLDYEAHYLEPAKAFVSAMGPRLEKIAPGVQAEPRVNGSIFRINRDVRFSKDKTPYKDHIDFIFWDGDDRKRAPCSFFLRVRAETVELGVGVHGFDKDALARFRARVADDQDGAKLEKVAARLAKSGLALGGEHYKKLPRGFDSISESRDRLLRHASLVTSMVSPMPKEAAGKTFPTWCVRQWKKMLPLRAWILALD